MKENWTYKKLGEVASFSRGLTFAKGDVVDISSKKVLRSNNIDLVSHSLNFDDVACLKEGFIIPDEKKLHKGDIFICMSNGSTQHLGKVAFIEDDMDYAFGGFMGAIHPDVKEVYPKYAFYSCLSTEYRRFLASILNGININNLKWTELSKFTIPVPQIETQSRIVAELDLLQSVIDKQKAQLKELDNLAQSIFYDMFGDPVENEKGWEMKKLEEICLNIVDCPHSTPKKSDRATSYPCIRTSELRNGTIYWDSMQYLDEENYKIRIARLKPIAGDIVFGREGVIGDAVVLPKGYFFSLGQRTMLLRANPSVVSNIFLHRVILSEWVKKQIKMANVSSTVAHLNIKDFKRFVFPIPPLSLQQSFAAKIESIEEQKAAINTSIEETQKLFDYTMDKYFGE